MKRITVNLTDGEYDAIKQYNSDVNERIKQQLKDEVERNKLIGKISISTSAAVCIFDNLHKKGYI